MNDDEKIPGLMETVCIVEQDCIPDLVKILTNYVPVRQAVLKYLNVHDLNMLSQAVQLSRACSQFQQLLLYEGAFRIIPYDINLLKTITPFIEGEREWIVWNKSSENERGQFKTKTMDLKFKILRIVSYKAQGIYKSGVPPFEKVKYPLDSISLAIEDEGVEKLFGDQNSGFKIYVSGFLEDNSAFFIVIRKEALDTYGRLTSYYAFRATSYKKILTAAMSSSMTRYIFDHLNTSPEQIKKFKELPPKEAIAILSGAANQSHTWSET